MPENEKRAPELSDDLVLIADAARKAGEIALGYFRQDPEVWWKGGKSPVSEADLEVDRFLKEVLLSARPDYGWLSEETAPSQDRFAAERLFVVDPIDGTRAFIDGRPTWCVSIAVVEKGRTFAGVLDCPVLEERYTALEGGGAFMNGLPILARTQGDEPGDEIIIAGPKAMLALLPADLSARTRPHGHVPSLAYRIAMVASGALDATFVKPNAHDWDIAAADLILREAGGAIVNSAGESLLYGGKILQHGALLAASRALLEPLKLVLSQQPGSEAGGSGL